MSCNTRRHDIAWPCASYSVTFIDTAFPDIDSLTWYSFAMPVVASEASHTQHCTLSVWAAEHHNPSVHSLPALSPSFIITMHALCWPLNITHFTLRRQCAAFRHSIFHFQRCGPGSPQTRGYRQPRSGSVSSREQGWRWRWFEYGHAHMILKKCKVALTSALPYRTNKRENGILRSTRGRFV